jgi:uncharacterized protein YegL
MRNDLTDITLVVDRSGSMATIQKDSEGGINYFIEHQKSQPGEAIFSLIQFDTEYDWVIKGENIKNVTHYQLFPRGLTALLDAVGRAILETGNRLNKMNEKDRPGLVIIVIVTDGKENSSKEFTKEKIKEMITHQQEIYKWQFTFLGANQDAFDEAGSIGINNAAICNFDPSKTSFAHAAYSANIARMRSVIMTGGIIDNGYTDEERRSME